MNAVLQVCPSWNCLLSLRQPWHWNACCCSCSLCAGNGLVIINCDGKWHKSAAKLIHPSQLFIHIWSNIHPIVNHHGKIYFTQHSCESSWYVHSESTSSYIRVIIIFFHKDQCSALPAATGFSLFYEADVTHAHGIPVILACGGRTLCCGSYHFTASQGPVLTAFDRLWSDGT